MRREKAREIMHINEMLLLNLFLLRVNIFAYEITRSLGIAYLICAIFISIYFLYFLYRVEKLR